MGSRESILAALCANQPEATALPEDLRPESLALPLPDHFTETLTGIGGSVVPVTTHLEIIDYIQENFPSAHIISQLPYLSSIAKPLGDALAPAHYHDVMLAVAEARIGVAENGSVWLRDDELGIRVLPFISEELAVVLPQSALVAYMHDAYALIGGDDYGFGVFIAGPSKTADIEQSLVLGAHGPKRMTVFLLRDKA